MQIARDIAACQLLTLAEAAPLVGLSHSHLRRLANYGKIWTMKKGNSWLTTEAVIRRYLANAPKPGPKAKQLTAAIRQFRRRNLPSPRATCEPTDA